MSNYQFAPSPTFGVSEHSFVTWENAFTEEQINTIIKYCESIPKQKAVVNIDSKIPKIRESDVSWIECNQDTQFIYDNLAYVARQLNGQFYKFNLYGFIEDLQYTIYDGNVAGHYTWHQDSGSKNGAVPRKLSLVLQLSDPSEYEGGDLEIFCSAEPLKIKKEKGLIAAFPSYMLHRVTPVTKGIRKTLVVWVCGEAFK